MKKLLTLTLLTISIFSKAQEKVTSYITLNAGYEYWNGNYGRLGADWYLAQPNNNIISLNANANLGYMKNEFRVIPEIGIGYLFNFRNNIGDPYSSYFNAPFYTTRVDISPWTISPKVGIAVLGLFEFNAGYAFEFNQYKNFKSMDGIRLGFTIHFPTQLL